MKNIFPISSVATLLLSVLLTSPVSAQEALQLKLTIRDMKQTFSSQLVAFDVTFGRGTSARTMPCRDSHGYVINLGQDLFQGWDPTAAVDVASRGREFNVVSCRDSINEVLGWFGVRRSRGSFESESTVSEHFLAEFVPSATPFYFRVRSKDSVKYFQCREVLEKRETRDTNSYKQFEITGRCDQIPTLPATSTGIVDFITTPGPYAAVAGYRNWIFPWAPATPANFEAAVNKLTAQIPVGTYRGAMSTLGKTCEVTIARSPGKLEVTHATTTPGVRSQTRRFSFTPDMLLGFVEGPVFAYEDVIRAGGPEFGTMAAAEFKKDAHKSVYLMFEKRTDREGLILRVDGNSPYCRRLVAQ